MNAIYSDLYHPSEADPLGAGDPLYPLYPSEADPLGAGDSGVGFRRLFWTHTHQHTEEPHEWEDHGRIDEKGEMATRG